MNEIAYGVGEVTDEKVVFSFSTERMHKPITNGDVIKALFPQMGVNEDWKATRSGQILSKDKKYVDISFACTSDWWNAPYKREGEENVKND